ncbi:MAG: MFS transporter [Planctomycetota bacterium]|nr:MAG: MFS transporter [Planctomycetota bacterium]REJ90599.1 MAG: MFS transporter [Planctomycetota bacterium]REK30030.1 MAG: MFS transporter [Planctomycetota bacterium]REK37727.1 MAG: MFS transporter [Planctomycetota bacterium]
MSNTRYLTAPPPGETKMPGGIPYIVGNEAAERFSYYGMNAILFVFMTQHLVIGLSDSGAARHMSDAEATTWVHNFKAAAYFFPIVGAVISDWLLGKYWTILSLSLVYCLGHATLALLDIPTGVSGEDILLIGLVLIAVGSGGIKPCVSAHVGDQFGAGNQHLLPRVFMWFYFSINLGAATSMIVTPRLLRNFGPGVAFGVPGVLMALATFVFWLGRNRFVHVPPARRRFFDETFSAGGLRAMGSLIPLYLFVAMFWALFDQTASRWVGQAVHMDRVVLGFEFLPAEIQSLNAILVMILIPVFSHFLYPLLGRFFEVTPLRKIGIGLFLTVPAFALPAWIQMRIDAGGTPTVLWQFFAYVIMTCAEVMVSITALEFSYTQAPPRMKSLIMGLYLLSVALGNTFAARVNAYIESQSQRGVQLLEGAAYYWFFTGCILVTAVLFLFWSPFYRGETYLQSSETVGEETGTE